LSVEGAIWMLMNWLPFDIRSINMVTTHFVLLQTIEFVQNRVLAEVWRIHVISFAPQANSVIKRRENVFVCPVRLRKTISVNTVSHAVSNSQASVLLFDWGLNDTT
jgi:hypothetical protein